MDDSANCIQDMLCYVDDLREPRVKAKSPSGVTRLKEWCRRRFGDCTVSLRRLFNSDRLSGPGKMLLAGAFLYCMVSTDVISDMYPIVGYLDDIVIVLAVMMYLERKRTE